MKKSYDAASLILPEHKKGYEKRIFDTVGLMLRCMVAAVCAYGLLSFLTDSVAIPVGRGWLFFVCLLICALFSLMVLFRKIAAFGTVLLTAIGAFCFFSAEAPIKTVGTTLTLFRNAWYSRLSALGYSYEHAITDIGDTVALLGYREGQLYATGVVFVALILCAVTVLCTVKRARFIPVASVCAVASTVILYFGAGADLFGFGLMISALFAVAALSFYDSVFVNKKNVMNVLGTDGYSSEAKLELSHALRQNRNCGGYVGFAALVMALIFCVGPMQLKGAMTDIPAVSNPIMRLENYISAIADGKTPGRTGFISLFGDELDRRPTEAKKRRQSGEELLLVGSDTSVPVYLRAWTGVDYRGDAWYTASYSREADFREMFGEDFSSEELFCDMRRMLDPTLEKVPDSGEVSANIPLGYVSSRVHIKKKTRGIDTVLPLSTRHTEGLFEYGKDTQHSGEIQNYYDGVIIDGNFGSFDDYSVIADISLTPDSTLAYNISVFVKYYSEQYSFIKEVVEKLENGADEAQIQEFFNTSYKEDDIVTDAYEALPTSYHFPEAEQSLAYRYVYEMDTAEREAVNALTRKLSTYNEYVYLNYTTLCENCEAFESLMGTIAEENDINFRRDAATYGGRHRSVAAVIDYLSSNMTYTTAPKARDRQREYYNGAETFLFDTKEGYCVQYATSAVMLLRSVGIPARYVEGYIAKDFEPSPDGISSYSCTVTDYDSHAWIEVYFDYFGWVRYEATAPYIKEGGLPAVGEFGGEIEMPPETGGDIPEIPIHGETEPISGDTEKSDPITTPKDGGNGVVMTVILLAIVLAGLIVAVLIMKARGDRAHEKMRKLINSVKRGNLTREQRILAARKMGDIVEKLLRRKSLVPMLSETAAQFAVRVDKCLLSDVGISFKSAMKAIQSGEFATDVSPDALFELAKYLEGIYEYSLRSGGILGYIATKYFAL